MERRICSASTGASGLRAGDSGQCRRGRTCLVVGNPATPMPDRPHQCAGRARRALLCHDAPRREPATSELAKRAGVRQRCDRRRRLRQPLLDAVPGLRERPHRGSRRPTPSAGASGSRLPFSPRCSSAVPPSSPPWLVVGGLSSQRRHRLGGEHLRGRRGGTSRRSQSSLVVSTTCRGLQFGFPVATDGSGWKVVEDLEHSSFAKERIRRTTEDLLEERTR